MLEGTYYQKTSIQFLRSDFIKAALNPKHPSLAGAHAEVHALNDALWAREAHNAAHGLGNVTKKELQFMSTPLG